MSCPHQTFETLLAHRFDPALPEPEGWPGVRRHLAQCVECRRRALAVDPSLLFDSLASASTSAAEQPTAEQMIQAVAAMRRAERVERVERAESARGWRGWAAAAGLTLVIVSFGALEHGDRQPASLPQLAGGDEPSLAWAIPTEDAAESAAGTLDDIPLVENPGPGFRVRETDGEDGSVAFVYQTELDEGLLGG